jgi:hypothetical protein
MRFESDQAISGSVKGLEYENGRSSMSGLISLISGFSFNFHIWFNLQKDWYFLSRVDFFVGTSSSQVGRMAYELMQTFHPNAAKNFVSLDDPWYFP